MDCAQSLLLLSEYRDGMLDEAYHSLIKDHLANCPPCLIIFEDIELIVTSAGVIRDEDAISYPDENIIWQRIRVTRTTIL